MIQPHFRFRINPFKNRFSAQNRKNWILLSKIEKKINLEQINIFSWQKYDSNIHYQLSKIIKLVKNHSKSPFLIQNWINYTGAIFKANSKNHWQTLQIQKKIKIKTASDWSKRLFREHTRMWQFKVIICKYR